MTDRFSVAERSAIMAGVRTRNTAPELRVKKLLRSMRIRYSSTALSLPGKPDILLNRLLKMRRFHGARAYH